MVKGGTYYVEAKNYVLVNLYSKLWYDGTDLMNWFDDFSDNMQDITNLDDLESDRVSIVHV